MRRLLCLSLGSLLAASALVSCTSLGSGKEDLTVDDLEGIANNPACVNPYTIEGDPDYWGSAAGLYCLPESGAGVVIRVYDRHDATAKMIDDWSELVTNDNQLIYGDDWFATGPASTLSTLLGEFRASGPQVDIPTVEQPTESEANIALCPSLVYDVTRQVLHSGETADLQQYFDNYTGMQVLVNSVASSSLRDGAEAVRDNDLLLIAALTKHDAQIKGFCSGQG